MYVGIGYECIWSVFFSDRPRSLFARNETRWSYGCIPYFKVFFSKLEVRERGSSALQSYYETAHGLRNADAQFFKIRTEDLKAGTEYEYRICTKEVKSFQPYKVVFGDSLTSKWYSFKTIDPHQKGASIFITSDIHNRPELLEKLLRYCDYQTCTSFFYAGDMMNYMEKSSNENPFSAFIDTSVKLFASSVPFEVVRGNHETRGNLARTFPSYFPKVTEKCMEVIYWEM